MTRDEIISNLSNIIDVLQKQRHENAIIMGDISIIVAIGTESSKSTDLIPTDCAAKGMAIGKPEMVTQMIYGFLKGLTVEEIISITHKALEYKYREKNNISQNIFES